MLEKHLRKEGLKSFHAVYYNSNPKELARADQIMLIDILTSQKSIPPTQRGRLKQENALTRAIKRRNERYRKEKWAKWERIQRERNAEKMERNKTRFNSFKTT